MYVGHVENQLKIVCVILCLSSKDIEKIYNLNYGDNMNDFLEINEKFIDKFKDKEFTCNICGFVTSNVFDMIEHLSCTQKYPEEDCTIKTVIIEKKKKI